MKLLEYDNFKEAFIGVNKVFIHGPKMLRRITTDMYTIGGLVVTTKSLSLESLNFSHIGYTKVKFNQLVSTYLDVNSWKEYLTLFDKCSKLSITYTFKNDKEARSQGLRFGCLLNLTMTREKSDKPISKVSIVWRTTEVNRKWAADLFFIAKLLEDFKDIKEVNLIMLDAYMSTMTVPPLLKPLFGISLKELNNTDDLHKDLKKLWTRYYKNLNGTNWDGFQHLALAQKLYWNYKNNTIKELTLEQLPKIIREEI